MIDRDSFQYSDPSPRNNLTSLSAYNSGNHRVTAFCSDSEAICLSLATPLGPLHAHITHTTPDAHCHKVERAIQQIDQKTIAILEYLPYHLPPKLILYLKKYCADCINLTSSSTQPTTPYVSFHRIKPQFNSDPDKRFASFGAVCLIKHTEGQRVSLAAKFNLNLHHVPKATIGVKIGFDHHHPGNDLFYCPPSTTPLIRNNYEIVSLIPFDWKPKTVLQQTYIQNINPTFEDILLRKDYPHHEKAVDQLVPIIEGPPGALHDPVTEILLPPTQHLETPTPPLRRYPVHQHRVPAHLACSLPILPDTTKSSLSVSNSEQSEFSIKKGLMMPDYRHAVGPAIDKELTKMFITYKALVLINKKDIPPSSTFFRFFLFLFLKLKFLPDHSFERMSARLCAMEMTPHPVRAETAYAATGDHHLFLLTVNAVLAAANQGGYKDKVEFQRYDVPAAFLQCLLPEPAYGCLPPDVRPLYGGAYVKILRYIYDL